jgi:hypothetical protein
LVPDESVSGGAYEGKVATVAALAGGAAEAYRLVRWPKPLRSHYSQAPRKGLIVGGGFGGCRCSRGWWRS